MDTPTHEQVGSSSPLESELETPSSSQGILPGNAELHPDKSPELSTSIDFVMTNRAGSVSPTSTPIKEPSTSSGTDTVIIKDEIKQEFIPLSLAGIQDYGSSSSSSGLDDPRDNLGPKDDVHHNVGGGADEEALALSCSSSEGEDQIRALVDDIKEEVEHESMMMMQRVLELKVERQDEEEIKPIVINETASETSETALEGEPKSDGSNEAAANTGTSDVIQKLEVVPEILRKFCFEILYLVIPHRLFSSSSIRFTAAQKATQT